VTLADHADGLALASLSPGTARELEEVLARARLQGIVAPRNPLDVTPILGDEGFTEAARILLADDAVEAAVVSCVPLTPALRTLPPAQGHPEDLLAPEGLVEGLAGLWADTRKPWVAAVDAGPAYTPFREALMARGIPVFPTADRAIRALASWVATAPSAAG
jgi:acyl-CoA synthetase (NDP forming)